MLVSLQYMQKAGGRCAPPAVLSIICQIISPLTTLLSSFLHHLSRCYSAQICQQAAGLTAMQAIRCLTSSCLWMNCNPISGIPHAHPQYGTSHPPPSIRALPPVGCPDFPQSTPYFFSHSGSTPGSHPAHPQLPA